MITELYNEILSQNFRNVQPQFQFLSKDNFLFDGTHLIKNLTIFKTF